MKNTIISIILVVTVFAIPDKNQRILENTREQNENGYNFRYSTSDGQARQETGRIEKVGKNLILRMSGSYSYTSSDGNVFEVVYEADEGGYKPSIHYKPSPKTSAINVQTKEHDSQVAENPSSDKPVVTVAGQDTIITGTSSGQVTENMEVFNISTPPSLIALQIGSAAIASLAGGGLG